MRVAVIGTGFIGKLVGPKLPGFGFPVTYVVSTPRSLAKAQALAAQIEGVQKATPNLADAPEGVKATSDYDAVLAASDVDAVYLGVPNSLHYDYATRALKAGKHVILEKPMASNYREAKEIVDLAKEKGLLLFDATTTFYQPSYAKVREWLPRVGTVKVAVANYSQYSSRYDRFKRGDIAPAFNPACSGGALMDLGHYCLSWLCGLFGEPESISYAANVERGIDTSGIALLDYGTFKATSIAAKDCGAPSYEIVQGNEGYIVVNDKPNGVGKAELHLNDGTVETFDPAPQDQYLGEFQALREFAQAGQEGLAACYEAADRGLVVAKVQTEARKSAGVVFPADK